MRNKKDRVQVFEDLKKIIYVTFNIETDIVTMDTPIYGEGISLDSVQMVELAVEIEKFYEVEFDDEMLNEENYQNFRVLVDVIMKLISRDDR